MSKKVNEHIGIYTVTVCAIVFLFLLFSGNGSSDKELSYQIETAYDDEITVNTSSAAEVTQMGQSEFILEGSFFTGSSTCSRASIEQIQLRKDGTVDVVLAPERIQKRVCTEDLASDSYRLVVNHGGYAESTDITVHQKGHNSITKELKLT